MNTKYNNNSGLEYTFNPETDSVDNPMPILQQTKANITNNLFIKPILQDNQTVLQDNNNNTSKINQQLSTVFIGFIDDCFNKPDNIDWRYYGPMILRKDNRFTYIIVFLIIISLFIMLG
jgi:hypothetical protein